MSYNKTRWVNNSAPAINATNLNNIENGIEDVDNRVTELENNSATKEYVDEKVLEINSDLQSTRDEIGLGIEYSVNPGHNNVNDFLDYILSLDEIPMFVKLTGYYSGVYALELKNFGGTTYSLQMMDISTGNEMDAVFDKETTPLSWFDINKTVRASTEYVDSKFENIGFVALNSVSSSGTNPTTLESAQLDEAQKKWCVISVANSGEKINDVYIKSYETIESNTTYMYFKKVEELNEVSNGEINITPAQELIVYNYHGVGKAYTQNTTQLQTYTRGKIDELLNAKQNTLVSGTNIKTINNQSILGAGNIDIISEDDIGIVYAPTEAPREQGQITGYIFDSSYLPEFNKKICFVSAGSGTLYISENITDGTSTVYTRTFKAIYTTTGSSGSNTGLFGFKLSYSYQNTTLAYQQVTMVNIANKQDTLVSGTNIKTINGNSVLGSGDLNVTTYQAFPNDWPTTSSYTTKNFCDTVNANSSAIQGMAYLGEVRWSDLPSTLANAEVVVEVMSGTGTSGKVIHLTLTSGNLAPYRWEYTYWNDGSSISGWKAYQLQLTAGNNITIDSNNVISATGGGGSASYYGFELALGSALGMGGFSAYCLCESPLTNEYGWHKIDYTEGQNVSIDGTSYTTTGADNLYHIPNCGLIIFTSFNTADLDSFSSGLYEGNTAITSSNVTANVGKTLHFRSDVEIQYLD